MIAITGCLPAPRAPAGDPVPAPGPAVRTTACEVLPPPTEAADRIVVALTEPVDPRHVPLPRNASERLVFSHLYESLLERDCTGALRPSLLGAWRRPAGERAWLLTLRSDPRWWNGAPVSAADVVASWHGHALRALPDRDWLLALVESASIEGERTFRVTLPDTAAEPTVLALPALALAGRTLPSGWPLGSGRQGLAIGAPAGSREIVTVPASGEVPPIEFRISPGRDGRDLLDAGADALVSDAPAALEYARARPDLAVLPLGWDRQYVLVIPAGEGSAPRADAADAALRRSLAAAVRGEARAAEPPFAWQTACPMRGAGGQPVRARAGAVPRIGYLRDDERGRALAERLVALASFAGESPARTALAASLPEITAGRAPVAMALDSASLASEARLSEFVAVVVSTPVAPSDPCGTQASLAARLPESLRTQLDRVILPLVETQSHLIARRGRIGATRDWRGSLTLYGTTAPRAAR